MQISTKTIVTVGMFAAVISVLSILTIPMPSGVPVTLQTFAIALGGYVLGAKRGVAATMVYLLLGAVGVPVYAGMTGGPSHLFSYTGGFLWGFILLSLFCGIGIRRHSVGIRIAFGVVGLFVCHLFGVLQFAIVTGASISEAFLLASAPYIIKDIISIAGACLAALPIRRALFENHILLETA